MLADDEIENIRNMVMKKNKNPKSRKKRGNQGRGAANSTATAAAKPPPPSPPPPADDPKTAEAANGHHSSNGGGSAQDATAAEGGAASTLPTPPGDSQAGEGGGASSKVVEGREAVKEVKTDFADSDDEIPLPEGVPGFEALEEAMLVRELTKDRLPGKIVRGSDGSENTASFGREWGRNYLTGRTTAVHTCFSGSACLPCC